MSDVRDVIVIGAGPSGSVVAKLLSDQGVDVEVVEAAKFPRFVIGESLLPQCNEVLRKAGMLDALKANADRLGFQRKNGAAFEWSGEKTFIDFRDKFSDGDGETWQVRRADFDQLLAQETAKAGVPVSYETRLVGYHRDNGITELSFESADGERFTRRTKFVMDGSGYGRALPRLLDLDTPSDLPPRKACFTHVEDHISDESFDREKILVTIHPENRDIWFWSIPFADGRCSLGVVGEAHLLGEGTPEEILRRNVAQVPNLSQLFENAKWDMPFRSLEGYSTNIKGLYGDGYCVLGNAGEFLDPVFSSGVTIAMKSAELAADCYGREHRGEVVDWLEEFQVPLLAGVEAFKTYVMGWYNGKFQDVIFFREVNHPTAHRVTQMIASVLAGYAWDTENPFVAQHARKLNSTADLIRAMR
ncbi:MAG: NAD(P)/FAD-dependent oxidoreductase [Gammaproteobacteria bacterium]|nr:NAD(P)/FAD-dependent oxidoreductase [Gammaproteobacteria bacterium]